MKQSLYMNQDIKKMFLLFVTKQEELEETIWSHLQVLQEEIILFYKELYNDKSTKNKRYYCKKSYRLWCKFT
ncbi:MAG: hypothetical protein CMM62_20760 [Rhodospirillaceae bacterium]|nr:hypothetical protein [Rhodospirillaceae bacterium]